MTQAGLAYTRDVAWQFFLRAVQKNMRVCLVCSSGARFQRRVREYPQLSHNMHYIWMGYWNKRQLVSHALHHLSRNSPTVSRAQTHVMLEIVADLKWMSRVECENAAHLLANMHSVLRQQDGKEVTSGQYNHLTNTSYETFVER